MISNAVKDTIKAMVDPDYLLTVLGVNVRIRNRKELRGPCPVHGGDNKTAFRFKRETKSWICFTKSCHLAYGTDSIGLVRGIMKCDFETALKFLAEITGVPLEDEKSIQINKMKNEIEMKKFASMPRREYIPPCDVSEYNLSQYKALRTDYFEQKENGGFPPALLDEFEIGGSYFDNYSIQREIIPIRNEEGELIAFSGRALEEAEPRYLLTNGFKKDGVLYNLHRAKEHLTEKNNRTIIVVEGFKAVWYLSMLGYDNVVACMGSKLTPGQINLLCKHAFNVVLMLDGGEAGLDGIKSAMEELKGKIKTTAIYIPDDKQSPDDYLPEIVIDWLKNVPN